MAKAKRGRPRKPRQQQLPGLEDKKYPSIERAAESYVEKRDARMALLKEEITRRDTLLREMQEHELTLYKFDGKKIEVTRGDVKVKVKAASDSVDVEEDDDADE